MKINQFLPLLLAAVLVCTACGAPPAESAPPEAPAATPIEETPQEENAPAEPGVPAVLAARYLMDRCYPPEEELPQLTVLTTTGEDFDAYCTGIYGVDRTKVADGVILSPSGMEAREVAIFRMTDEEAALAAQEAFALYLEERRAAFTGYAPDQEALLRTAVVDTCDCWAMLLCPGAASAGVSTIVKQFIQEQAAKGLAVATDGLQARYTLGRNTMGDPAILDENGYELFLQPGLQPMPIYDTAPIAAAWETGDDSKLTGQEKEIFAVCQEAMELVDEDMSAYEKELALHDWLIGWADYNKDGSGQSDSDTSPYGILVQRKGTCMGYSNTFQLLMDLADVPCRTVSGAVLHSLGDHAWNIVQLDGEWYCVDITWNDPFGAAEHYGDDRDGLEKFQHRYFNVTSDYMRGSDHLWDYYSVPEAAAAAYAWSPEN